MNQETLQKINAYCADFKKFRATTADGQGNNLHDIKNTFDYVAKTVDEYKLTGTRFGSNLSAKAKEASQVLSQLWVCLQDLEKALGNFTDNQSSNNNQVGGQGSTTATTLSSTAAPKKSASEIAQEVWQGKWGSGSDREKRLRDAGYDPAEVQRIVNQTAPKPSGSGSTGNRDYTNPVQSPTPTTTSTSTPTRSTPTRSVPATQRV